MPFQANYSLIILSNRHDYEEEEEQDITKYSLGLDTSNIRLKHLMNLKRFH
ncbi:hypothetical protein COCNU_02G016740 [Cocos nucifera]|uniref:Uncharacterized protein n=1 Tax=Cocos nucifera TaxID=13894 RepID=A0A8K0I0M6_COCNU|nr:hypothetical protein COCNU_02G016740 [Cocos nucifera]